MIDQGCFDEDARLELIRGEILQMTPVNDSHAACVAALNTLLVIGTVGQAYVWPQGNPLRIPSHSRPQPDLVLLRWRDDRYRHKPPLIEDVLLVVEVSDTSLSYDRRVKGPLYAEAGIPEYWIVNLPAQVVEVHTGIMEGKYRRTRRAKRGDTLPLPAPLQGEVAVSDILGPPGAM